MNTDEKDFWPKKLTHLA